MKLIILGLPILAASAEAVAIDRVGLNRSVGATGGAFCDASGLIIRHEGSRSCSYTDTTGHRTVGVGFNMDAVSASRWSSICGSCPRFASVRPRRRSPSQPGAWDFETSRFFAAQSRLA